MIDVVTNCVSSLHSPLCRAEQSISNTASSQMPMPMQAHYKRCTAHASSHPILHFSLSTFHPKCVCQGQLLPMQYELSKSNRDRDQLMKQVKDLQEAQVYCALSCCQRSHHLPSISCLLPSTICLLSAVSCSSLLELRRPLFSYFASSFTLHCIVLFCTLTKGHLICPILLPSTNQRNFTV